MRLYITVAILTLMFSAVEADAFLRENDVIYDSTTLKELEMIVYSYIVKNGQLPSSIDESGIVDINEVLHSTGSSGKNLKTKLTGSIWGLARCHNEGNKVIIDKYGKNICGIIDQIDAQAVCRKNLSGNDCKNIRGTIHNYIFVIKYD